MLFILFVLIIVAAVILFKSYNTLRGLSEKVKSRRANITASIKKRQDIAQRLADIAKSYGDHEKLHHFSAMELDGGIASAREANADASQVISSVQQFAQRYPDLKASQIYQELMAQLEHIETQILERREDYNQAAESYNGKRGSLPELFYAEKMGYGEAPYFSIDDEGNEKIVEFQTDDGRILRESVGRVASFTKAGALDASRRVKGDNSRPDNETGPEVTDEPLSNKDDRQG
ncbi:LemA family protein [Carnimonas nigrificans]|uniref:LemA family protein n=1 Tax=Carnimonas nigrificans TaxID=64323 RepID=UPI0004713500|nr:LemA family protein [Carnimonas nigrificans]